MPYTDPEKQRAYLRQYNAAHRDKHRERLKKWHADNPTWQRNYDLKKKRGISAGQYEAMSKKQAGRCAICGTEKAGGHGPYFHVDHDHVTGRVRGLLCLGCNTKLGWYEKRQLEIMAYLLEHAGSVT